MFFTAPCSSQVTWRLQDWDGSSLRSSGESVRDATCLQCIVVAAANSSVVEKVLETVCGLGGQIHVEPEEVHLSREERVWVISSG